MNCIKRSITSILRKPRKSLILLGLVFLLGTLASGAISIRLAIHNTEGNLRAKLPPVTTLFWDYEAVAKHYNISLQQLSWERTTREMIIEVGSLPYVKDYDFTIGGSLVSRDLEWATLSIDPDLLPDSITLEELTSVIGGLRDSGAYVESFSIRGIQNPNITDIQSGLISLASGRVFTQEEIDRGLPVVVISRSLADTNNLQVGSRFVLENNVYDNLALMEEGVDFFPLYWHVDDFILASQKYEFEVIGIFDVEQEFYYSDDTSAIAEIYNEVNLHNQVYIPSKISEEIHNFSMGIILENEGERNLHGWGDDVTAEELLFLESLFVLHDSRDFSAFAEAAGEILPEFWEVRDLSSVFGTITNSMDTMLWIADLILWVTAGAAIVILSLLITLFLRDRKHEMGIYLALGEKKGKVISQILIEILSVSVVALTLALFSGRVLSNTISKEMIKQDISRQEQESSGFNQNVIPWELMAFNPGTMAIEEMMAAYDTSMDGNTISILFGVSMGTILISTTLPILYVIQLNPRKILL